MKVGMIRDAAQLAVPMARAQGAVFTRRWGWTLNSWDTFVKENPYLLENVEKQRQEILEHSLFEQAYPNPKHPMAANWEKVKAYGETLPLEKLPGFTFPKTDLI